jgi:hypothetical protein
LQMNSAVDGCHAAWFSCGCRGPDEVFGCAMLDYRVRDVTR